MTAPEIDEFTLALDWTPNINHVGFFVALSRGYYTEGGLKVRIVSPHSDDYKATPAQKVINGAAHVAICPSESVISHASQSLLGAESRLVAVAAGLARDTSAIVTVSDSGIARPKDLSGKRYASYGARYEGRIVQQMIKNDGGDGEYIEDTAVGMLGIWNTILAGKADATWVFMAWEGVMAKLKDVSLNTFRLDDYKIPYGYSPILAANANILEETQSLLKKFMQASSKGWQDFVDDPQACAREATAAMNKMFPELKEPVDEKVMTEAATVLAPNVLPAGKGSWGHMDITRWDAFLDWLSESGLLTTKMQSRNPEGDKLKTSLDGLRAGDVGEPIERYQLASSTLFTNDMLPPMTQDFGITPTM